MEKLTGKKAVGSKLASHVSVVRKLSPPVDLHTQVMLQEAGRRSGAHGVLALSGMLCLVAAGAVLLVAGAQARRRRSSYAVIPTLV
jgi:hypothetical protein